MISKCPTSQPNAREAIMIRATIFLISGGMVLAGIVGLIFQE